MEPMTDIEVVSMADSLVEPFSIFNSPLLRVRMFQTDRYAYLFFDVHHLLMDGSSLSIVLADVVRAYKGEASSQVSTISGRQSLLPVTIWRVRLVHSSSPCQGRDAQTKGRKTRGATAI